MKTLSIVFLSLLLADPLLGQYNALVKCAVYTSSTISEDPYNPSWDWEAGDVLLEGIPHYWIYFQNKPNAIEEYAAIAPWYQYGAWAGLVDRKKNDGWILLSRNFGTPTRRIVNKENPYFVLFNTNRSIIRVFILLQNMTDTYEYSTMEIKKYNNGGPSSGVLAHLSSVAFAIDKVSNIYNNASSSVIGTLAMQSRWVCADFPLAYDPQLLPKENTEIPSSLEFQIYGSEVKNILLETKGFGAQGDKNFVEAFMKRNNFDSPNFSLNAANMPKLDIDFSLPNVDIKATAPNWEGLMEFSKNLKLDMDFGSIGTDNSLGELFNGFAGALSSLSLSSPFGIAGLDLGRLFKFFVGGGMGQNNIQQTAPSFISSHYTSKGSMTSRVPYAVLTIPLPSSRINYKDPMIGNPVGILRNDPVGIITLTKTPVIKKTHYYKNFLVNELEVEPAPMNTYIVSEDIQFQLNPSANLEIKKIEASLVFSYTYPKENSRVSDSKFISEWTRSYNNQRHLMEFETPINENTGTFKSLSVPIQFFKNRTITVPYNTEKNVLVKIKATLQRKDDPLSQPVVFISTYYPDIVIDNTLDPEPILQTIPPQNITFTIPSTGGVRIVWDINPEKNIKLYSVERSINSGAYIQIGTTAETYFIDNEVKKAVKAYDVSRQNVSVSYRVRALSQWTDDDNTNKLQFSEYSRVVSLSGSIVTVLAKFGTEMIAPETSLLSQNFPNPFNPSTTIYYGVKKSGLVNIKVFNALGQEVATLVNDVKEVGYHYAEWNATGLPSGMYFYRITVGDFTETKKMTLMK